MRTRSQWRRFLDVSAFYDPRRSKLLIYRKLSGRRGAIASVSYQLGLLKDRALVDSGDHACGSTFSEPGHLFRRCPPTGRLIATQTKYARFVWEAAAAADRQDILAAVRPH
jgi:hypothetical protein